MQRVVYKYVITGTTFKGEIELWYDAETKLLTHVDADTDLQPERLIKLWGNMPIRKADVEKLAVNGNKVELTSAEPTFDDFWEAYDYKVDKQVAKTRWEAMGKKDRIAAINHIPVYNDFLKKKPHDRLMPSTYLNKKRWLDNK